MRKKDRFCDYDYDNANRSEDDIIDWSRGPYGKIFNFGLPWPDMDQQSVSGL